MIQLNSKAYIYKITNKINRKSYIGVTRDRSVFARWDEHLNTNHELNRDIQRYSITAFSFEVLEEFNSISDHDLFRYESRYINKYNTINNGYNLILSSNRENRNHEYSEQAKEGLHMFTKTPYYGTLTSNSNHRNSFWKKLGDERTCFISLLMESNYMSRPTSKYRKVLDVIFHDRNQKYFRIDYGAESYYTDNLDDLSDILSITREQNRHLPYTLIEYYIDQNYIEIDFSYKGSDHRIKIYSPLLYEDETIYMIPVDEISEILDS